MALQIGKNKGTWLNKALGNPYVVGGTLIGGPLGGAVGGLIGSSINKQKERNSNLAQQKKDLEASLANIPEYEIPQEAKDYLAMLEQTSEDLSKTGDIYQNAVDIAKTQSASSEAPGAGIARDDIQASTAQQLQYLRESGNVGAIGAVANVGSTEQQALRDLAKTNLQYKSEASQNLQGALMGQAGFESNLLQQQASLKGAGLQSMIGEKDKSYQSNLNKYLTMTDYQLAQLGVSQQEIENIRNRRVQIASSVIGIIPDIAKLAAGA